MYPHWPGTGHEGKNSQWMQVSPSPISPSVIASSNSTLMSSISTAGRASAGPVSATDVAPIAIEIESNPTVQARRFLITSSCGMQTRLHGEWRKEVGKGAVEPAGRVELRDPRLVSAPTASGRKPRCQATRRWAGRADSSCLPPRRTL